MKDRSKYVDRVGGRCYFRANGKRLGSLPGAEGSPEWNAAYDRLHAMAREQQREAADAHARHARGEVGVASIEWFIQKYLASDWFVGRDGKRPKFSEGTQANYRPGLESLRVDVLKGMRAPMGVGILGDLTAEKVDVYLATVARERSATVAQLHKVLLSNLWKFARGFVEFQRGGKTNPCADAGGLYTVEQEHEPWPDDVQDRFLAACDDNLYLAYHLLLCTGQRLSDVVAMQWADWDGERFKLTQQKTGAELWIKAPTILRELLAKTPRVHAAILTHKWQQPYTRDSLGHRIKEVLVANGDGDYTTHGLRKNAGILLAENGATVPQIMAALGHTTPKMALYYCRLANQKLLNDQAAAILDLAFAQKKDGKVAARRAQIRRVK